MGGNLVRWKVQKATVRQGIGLADCEWQRQPRSLHGLGAGRYREGLAAACMLQGGPAQGSEEAWSYQGAAAGRVGQA